MWRKGLVDSACLPVFLTKTRSKTHVNDFHNRPEQLVRKLDVGSDSCIVISFN